jgi:hypothetical protein
MVEPLSLDEAYPDGGSGRFAWDIARAARPHPCGHRSRSAGIAPTRCSQKSRAIGASRTDNLPFS